jgi:hypothetical protein
MTWTVLFLLGVDLRVYLIALSVNVSERFSPNLSMMHWRWERPKLLPPYRVRRAPSLSGQTQPTITGTLFAYVSSGVTG